MNLTFEQIKRRCPKYLRWYFKLKPLMLRESSGRVTSVERHKILSSDATEHIDLCKKELLGFIWTDMIVSLIADKFEIKKLDCQDLQNNYYLHIPDGIIEQLKRHRRILDRIPADFEINVDEYVMFGNEDDGIFFKNDNHLFDKKWSGYNIFLHKESMRRNLLMGYQHIEDVSDGFPDRVGFYAQWGIELFNFEKHYMFKAQ